MTDPDWPFPPPPRNCWVCEPCGGSSRTLVALWEPRCPYCGRKYDPGLMPAEVNDAAGETPTS